MRCGENRRGSSGQQEGNDDSSLLKSINIDGVLFKPSQSFEYLTFHPFSWELEEQMPIHGVKTPPKGDKVTRGGGLNAWPKKFVFISVQC